MSPITGKDPQQMCDTATHQVIHQVEDDIHGKTADAQGKWEAILPIQVN